MASPAFSLITAVARLKRSRLFNRQRVAKETLVQHGDDGRIFFTQNKPLDAMSTGSLVLFASSGSLLTTIAQSEYTVDDEAGCIVFNAQQTDQILADYYFCEFIDDQLKDFCREGVDELELRWARGWTVYDDGSEEYVAAFDGSTYTDPVVASTTGLFSTTPGQVALYLLCCEYRFALGKADFAAQRYFAYREGGGGVSIDRSRQPEQLRLLAEGLNKQIDKAVKQQMLADANQRGGWVENKMSQDYKDNFYWQDGAVQR